jgi:RHS repeat-associated protein
MVAAGVTTRFLYDGAQVIAEYNGANALQRRFVAAPGLDEPLVWYEGSGTTDRRYLIQDERGSVVAITNSAGAVTNINTYDAYGAPGATNVGRFQYTGQMWLGEIARYHYRARAYDPGTGRFHQADPIGFGGGMNIYAYVANDPVNFTDPLGLQTEADEIVVPGHRPPPIYDFGGFPLQFGFEGVAQFERGPFEAAGAADTAGEIVVTARSRKPPPPRVPPVVRVSPAFVFLGALLYQPHAFDECGMGDMAVCSGPEHRPARGLPPGTVPIDQAGLGRDLIHKIKRGIIAAPDDWVGIDPSGGIWTTDPQTGDAVYQGQHQ